jgi:hypothetical protein
MIDDKAPVANEKKEAPNSIIIMEPPSSTSVTP